MVHGVYECLSRTTLVCNLGCVDPSSIWTDALVHHVGHGTTYTTSSHYTDTTPDLDLLGVDRLMVSVVCAC